MIFDGTGHAPILFVTDFQRTHCKAENKVFSEFLGAPLFSALKRAGLYRADYDFVSLEGSRDILHTHPAKVIVPLGENCLNLITGMKSISKWHISFIPATAEYGQRLCLPMYHPEHVMKFWQDHVYYQFGCHKLKDMPGIPERKFILNPSLQQTLAYLRDTVATAPAIAIDFEFGQGQLNTVGFAISPTEAIAIKTLPDDYTPEEYHALFMAIGNIMESNIPKIVQHAAIEVTWAARYGIQINNVVWDTMWAMKFLYPELEKGLDNVGRVFTPYPYWKDDNDSWTNIRDWQRHLEYNCKDTTATFCAYLSQQKTLDSRKLLPLFENFLMKFQPVIQEMCVTGLNINPATIMRMKEELDREHINFMKIIDQECQEHLNKTINPKSPKQLKEALVAMGMKLPTKRVKGKADEQTSTDKKALVKLRRKYPEAQILPALIGLSATNKKLSSYVNFEFERETNKVHYTLDGCGTETGRWAGFGSAWGNGFNPQTVPKNVRRCFVADPGTVLVQIDLQQAESRYVAWDGPDAKLMDLITAGHDVHRYFGGKIFNKEASMITYLERQLAKKAGHAKNYDTGPRTFAEMCLVEMNYYVEEHEAKKILDAYDNEFPGVKRRKQNIKQQVYQQRMLRTPLGRERHFFGRMDDSTFREAYAYCPQSTIPDITNHLMLALWEQRDSIGLSYEDGGRFLLQVHDSLLLQCQKSRMEEIAGFAKDLKAWHPDIILPGGRLLIPVDVEFGNDWKNMEKIL